MTPDTHGRRHAAHDRRLVARKNSDGRYRGTITLRQAFAQSSNVAAVRLTEAVGASNVIRAARDLGITSPLGDRAEPRARHLERDAARTDRGLCGGRRGQLSGARTRAAGGASRSWFDRFVRSASAASAATRMTMLLDLLSAAANDGTGRAARAARSATFGKTGTTQDNRDAMFIGFAGDLVVGRLDRQ